MIDTVIEFNQNKVPDEAIYEYAISIKKSYPKIWDLGNRENGDRIFPTLEQVVKRKSWLNEEIGIYRKWQSYIIRHQHDYRIVGVVSMLKRLSVIDKGLDFMKQVIEKEIKQQYRD